MGDRGRVRGDGPGPGRGRLSPAAAGRLAKEKLAAGATSIVMTTIEPLSGPDPVTVTREIGESEVLTVGTASVRARRTR